MDSTNPTPQEPALPGFGIARDVRQLKTHGAASVAELREFLAETRGRRPQDVLGLIAGSHLMRSVAVATVGVVALLAVGTVGPWAWNRWSADASAVKPSEPPKAAVAAPTGTKTAEQPPAESPAPVADAKPSPADAEKAVRVMGLDDTKVADPKTNPLEKTLDNLLDKLE